MGSGQGNVDICLIMRIAAWLCCAVALGLNIASTTDSHLALRISLVSNSLAYSVSTYIFIVAFFFLFALIFKADVEEKLHLIALICGFLWTVGAGVGVILYHIDYKLHTLQLVGGILAMVAGVVMLIDALHISHVF